MKLDVELDRSELAALERVAEGRATTLTEMTTGRLLALGLVQIAEPCIGDPASLQLTMAGLSLIHSSDQ